MFANLRYFVCRIGKITLASSLFTYDDHPHSYYNPIGFEPVFYSGDLVTMFPAESERLSAVRLCLEDSTATEDPEPNERKQCYYDLMMTGSHDIALDTKRTSEGFVWMGTLLGKSMHLTWLLWHQR